MQKTVYRVRTQEHIHNRIAGRTDIKPPTRINMEQARARLVEYFCANRNIRDISPGEADAWAIWLKDEDYADGTAGRTVKLARQIFKAAIRLRLLRENPFADVKAASEVNDERKFFITREVAAAVLDACPNAEWRLIFALSRFGSLRCPSEHQALEWSNVDWDRERFLVNLPKTGPPWVPLFPELRPYFDDCYELAQEAGAVHVISLGRDPSVNRHTGVNLRMQLLRIIARGG